MSTRIFNFASRTKSIIENSQADPASKKLVADVLKELTELLEDISDELKGR